MSQTPTPAVVITVRDGERHRHLARAFATLCNEHSMDTVTGIPDFALGEYLAWSLQHLAAVQARTTQFFGGTLAEWKARAEPPAGQRMCTPEERAFLDTHAITPAEVSYLNVLRSLTPTHLQQLTDYALVLANRERTGGSING